MVLNQQNDINVCHLRPTNETQENEQFEELLDEIRLANLCLMQVQLLNEQLKE